MRFSVPRRILIATDLDGTLCPIPAYPAEARLSHPTVEILRRIRGCEMVTLAVISGRALEDVLCRIPAGLVYAGMHGLESADTAWDSNIPPQQNSARSWRLPARRSLFSRAIGPELWRINASRRRCTSGKWNRAITIAAARCQTAAGRVRRQFRLRSGNQALDSAPVSIGTRALR